MTFLSLALTILSGIAIVFGMVFVMMSRRACAGKPESFSNEQQMQRAGVWLRVAFTWLVVGVALLAARPIILVLLGLPLG